MHGRSRVCCTASGSLQTIFERARVRRGVALVHRACTQGQDGTAQAISPALQSVLY